MSFIWCDYYKREKEFVTNSSGMAYAYPNPDVVRESQCSDGSSPQLHKGDVVFTRRSTVASGFEWQAKNSADFQVLLPNLLTHYLAYFMVIVFAIVLVIWGFVIGLLVGRN